MNGNVQVENPIWIYFITFEMLSGVFVDMVEKMVLTILFKYVDYLYATLVLISYLFFSFINHSIHK